MIHPALATLLGTLWSGGDATREPLITIGHARPAHYRLVERYVAVPGARRPRFLIPIGRRSAMARLLTAYLPLRGRGVRVARRLLAVLASAGALGRVAGDVVAVWLPSTMSDIELGELGFTAHLRGVMGATGALAAIGLGRMDLHYKPTVQLFSASGEPLAFAKLGWSEPTGALVRREAEALRRQRQRLCERVQAPDLVRTGRWHTMPYLVTAPLPTDVAAVPEQDPMPEIAKDVAGRLTPYTLLESPYWREVRRRLQAIWPASARGLAQEVHRAVDRLEQRAGHATWMFGHWHGDWTPWNAARSAGRVVAWDWEHSSTHAPWGFDILHWLITVAHLRHADPYPDCIDAVAHHAIPQVDPTDMLPLLLAYLVEMGLRSGELAATADRAPRAQQPELYPGLARTIRSFTNNVGSSS